MSKFKIGDKVVPKSKSYGCSLKSSNAWINSQKMDQPFLYVVMVGEYKYSCDETKGNITGDYFKEKDLVLYKEEKDMNEMPELKAGMIVKGNFSDNLFLYINDSWAMNLNLDRDWINISEHDKDFIIEIYECVHYSKTYTTCTQNLKLIWSRKSDKDIEIEEIQKEMDKLNKRMEGLKEMKNERN